jgi:hypothetical protein
MGEFVLLMISTWNAGAGVVAIPLFCVDFYDTRFTVNIEKKINPKVALGCDLGIVKECEELSGGWWFGGGYSLTKFSGAHLGLRSSWRPFLPRGSRCAPGCCAIGGVLPNLVVSGGPTAELAYWERWEGDDRIKTLDCWFLLSGLDLGIWAEYPNLWGLQIGMVFVLDLYVSKEKGFLDVREDYPKLFKGGPVLGVNIYPFQGLAYE